MEVSRVLEKKAFAQATLCDPSKAFGYVHSMILLQNFSIIVLVKNPSCSPGHLSNRRLKVCIDEHWLKERVVAYGVSQGPILGPLLFLTCINDLSSSVSVQKILYEEDTTVLIINTNPKKLNLVINNTLQETSD